MEYVNFLIALLQSITYIAAAELGIPFCQPLARQQQMRRGYTHQFHRGPRSDHVYRGTGSAYRNGTTGSYLTCAGMCLRDDACKSFNFCLDKKRCELNAAVLSDMTDLIFSAGCLYFDEATTEPQVPCLNPEPLGFEDGTIPDEHFNASSDLGTSDGHIASFARLNRPRGWASEREDANPWIEVDLGGSKIVSGIITQGCGGGWWAEAYKILYARPPSSSTSEYVTDANGDVQIFVGNEADDTPVTNMFHQSIVATVVRIEPVTWYGSGVGMRIELLGCHN